MINLLECLPRADDATSFYRARGPLLRLQKEFPQEIAIYPYHNGPVTWDYILLYDAVFLQRPYNKHHYNVARAAERFKIPIIIDYDDLLCDIPTDNPAKDHYDEDAVKMIGALISITTVVIVSTEALKKYLSEKYGYENKFVVIPNAFDLEIFREKPVFNETKSIIWRGSVTHTKDIMEYSAQIISAMCQFPDWHIDFLGYNPFFITDKLSNSAYVKRFELDIYIEYLHKLNYSICIVPLHDSPFNRSKSNINYLEATYAGAVCLAPDWEEWQKPGIINYKDQADFRQKLKAMIAGEYDLKDLHQKSWQYIVDNLSLAKVNKLRWEIMRQQVLQ